MIDISNEIGMPEVNIGMVGHVDHGKTSLTSALTGKWTDTHSEEMKRGITIRLGYADTTFHFCEKCQKYCATKKCLTCFSDCTPRRTVSFVDAPGHETLMATVLSGTALMDGALLVIGANEKCPQPQTAEHLKALDIAGINKIVIAQNKIDLVSEENAKKNYDEIKTFVKGTVAENAPIIPVSAIHNINIDALIETIETVITTPERQLSAEPKFYIARSFDINRPGSEIDALKGAVFGGSITRGIFSVNDEIEIKPGIKNEKTGRYETLKTKIVEIIQGGQSVEKGKPGGLVALQTELDPSLSRGDRMAGNIIGYIGKITDASDKIKFRVNLFDYIIGTSGHEKISRVHTNDALMITATIAKSVGIVVSAGSGQCEMKLKIPVCVNKEDKIALSKQVGGRWHLIGWGVIV